AFWRLLLCVRATFTAPAPARGNSEHSRAAVPATNGVAALVPSNVNIESPGPVLVMFSPGAVRPHLPAEPHRFELEAGRPELSHAITGIVQTCPVRAVPPRELWFPVAAT